MNDVIQPALQIRNLKTWFRTDYGEAHAVDGVSLDIPAGKTIALVGESGCGKSVTALSIMRLIPQPPGRYVDGEILLDGKDLLKLTEKQMRTLRGNEISMIFQEPMTSLNPVFRVGSQIGAAIRVHKKVSKKEARNQTIELLAKVGIPSPEDRVDDYPHQMSGGMRQRVMIAMALACGPRLLIADEPTTALDVTIQAQILDLLQQLQAETGMAMLLITHDLGIVAETAEEVAIMYAGKIVEHATVRELFNAPKHPYTIGLFESLPGAHQGRERLRTIKGNVPAATNFPSGCRFHPRCPHAMDVCTRREPPLEPMTAGHPAACWLHDTGVMGEQDRPVGVPGKVGDPV
ncbi:MAG: ABC transporter ATP-binding protein [Candidatus Hydrogenedentes bacterium]|nr:ABC transporter ATP-binding protein [Candidatus Hydrogenedentota bacterium]